MKATVIAIEPYPQIEDGHGQVILKTVNHLNNYLFRLTVTDNNGKIETIGVTDAGLVHLNGVTRLSTLSLNGTKVTESGIKYLQAALLNCKIELK